MMTRTSIWFNSMIWAFYHYWRWRKVIKVTIYDVFKLVKAIKDLGVLYIRLLIRRISLPMLIHGLNNYLTSLR